jgi:hypothetical protein
LSGEEGIFDIDAPALIGEPPLDRSIAKHVLKILGPVPHTFRKNILFAQSLKSAQIVDEIVAG